MRVIGALVIVAAMTLPAAAHHSISAAYDDGRRVTVDGVVQQFQFVNPHPLVVLQVSRDGAAPETWRLEMDSRNELAAIGMNQDTLRQGDRVVVTGSVSRTQPMALYIRSLERPADGFAYEQIGSSPRLRSQPRR
jgi:hypothetical protein